MTFSLTRFVAVIFLSSVHTADTIAVALERLI